MFRFFRCKHIALRYLIFCNSKRKCDELDQKFNGWGIEAVALHGDLQQNKRDWHLESFKNGSAKCMFATDVASRGLDIPNVTAVINYDPHDEKETHVHRIGRTGRAGAKGLAITFAMGRERMSCPQKSVYPQKFTTRHFTTRFVQDVYQRSEIGW